MTASTDPASRKRALRAELRARRRGLDPATSADLGSRLGRVLVDLVTAHAARRVTCYLPTAGEPDTLPFLEWTRARGLEVLLPVSREDGALEWALDEGPRAPGLYGIPEPAGPRLPAAAAGEADLILAPALAVSRDGFRLGQGKGYFDRLLSGLPKAPPVFAVVYDHEVLDDVPRETHDRAVAGVVTPGGWHGVV